MCKRILKRDYTSEEMNRGDGMKFHPLCGMFLQKLFYCKDNYLRILDPQSPEDLFSLVSRILRMNEGRVQMISVLLFPISDGKPHKAGEGYLLHWKFDPWTGLPLQ